MRGGYGLASLRKEGSGVVGKGPGWLIDCKIAPRSAADAAVIRANVPLATLLGYRCSLSSITNGLGDCAIRFSHFAEAPRCDGPDDFRPTIGMRA